MGDYVKEYLARTPGSKNLFERAEKVIPGGVCHGPRYFAPHPLYINKTRGSKIYDVDGNEYVDLWMGHYSHIMGHQPEHIARLLEEKIGDGTHWGIVNQYQVDFAEEICRIVPCAERVRFGVSGTEATMYAVRLARAYTGRNVILKVRGGWHGPSTDLSVAVHSPMDVPESAGLPPGVAEYTKTISYNETEQTLEMIGKYQSDLAGVILEGVGQYFIPPEAGYLEAVQKAVQKAGGLFILDEVITGCRLGITGAQGRYNLQPDLTTMGKVLGGGMNLGLVAGRRDIMDLSSATSKLSKDKKVLMGGGTFSCMPPAMITGRTMLKYLDDHKDEVYPVLEEKGKKVREGVEQALRSNNVRANCFGVGSLFTTCFPNSDDSTIRNFEDVEINSDMFKREQEFRVGMLNKGVYTMYGGGAVSLAHTDEDIKRIIDAAEAVAHEMADDF